MRSRAEREAVMAEYQTLDPATKIRIAVREHAVLSILNGSDLSRLGDPIYDADLPEIIERWTGVDPLQFESGLDIIREEAEIMRAAFGIPIEEL